MKTKLVILLLLASFVTDLTSQEKITPAVNFGERVIQDYLSFYKTQQKAYPKLYAAVHLWFEDSDTRQMTSSFLDSQADSINVDTIFFIHGRNIAWAETNWLEIIPSDTLFGLNVKCLDGGYRSFEVYKTPFLNAFSKTYWEDLCEWDTAHISKPSKYVVNDGPHYHVVRLIYSNGLLVSTEFCHHESKTEYDAEWYRPELDIKIPYPENKQWPQIKL